MGGICLSFFLSAGELQAPCTKENEFPESVRQHQADGFSRHRINNQGGLPPYLRAAFPSAVAGGSAVGPATAGGKAAVII